MMFPPFYRYPYYRNYPSYYNNYYRTIPNINPIDNKKEEVIPYEKQEKKTSSHTETRTEDSINDKPLFEIMGIKLYFDDILLLCLIFFLYQEGTDDSFLMIALVLLLMS